MKTTIRYGVFETNSSNNHTISISHDTKSDIYNSIVEDMTERYKNNNYSDYNQYLTDKTFSLEGVYMEEGGECGCVYYVFNSWWSKIQYMSMILFEVSDMFYDYKKPNKYDYPYYDIKNGSSVLNKSKVGQAFCELVKEYIMNKGIEVDKVVFDMEYTTSIYSGDFIERYFPNMTIKENDIMNMFSDIMSDEVSITSFDTGNHPFEKPIIEFL